MKIIICGAGEVGEHAAETLVAANHRVTVVDHEMQPLAAVEDSLDARTLLGNCADGRTLREAGCADADLLLATTDHDEINLLTAAIAKGLGARKTIARVHHSTYFEGHGFDYEGYFQIDRLICPEYSTALAIAQTLRNPGAMAIEHFARGQIEMQQFPVSRGSEAIGKALAEIRMPRGTRIAAIGRMESALIPEAGTVIEQGDSVIIVGNPDHFQTARRIFHDDKLGRRRIVIMGGPPMAVWLCRALRDRNFSIRLFETNPQRAQELAEKLDWVTVIQADPTHAGVVKDERIADADAFVALVHDEENILGCMLAKSAGIEHAIAVIERPKYVPLLREIGIDRPFSPRRVAVKEIVRALDDRSLSPLASLAEGVIDVYRVRVGPKAEAIGKPLHEIKLTPNWMLAAVQHDGAVRVPGADDQIEAGDTVIVIGRHGKENALKKIFNA